MGLNFGPTPPQFESLSVTGKRHCCYFSGKCMVYHLEDVFYNTGRRRDLICHDAGCWVRVIGLTFGSQCGDYPGSDADRTRYLAKAETVYYNKSSISGH
jgi:hypothetical protein